MLAKLENRNIYGFQCYLLKRVWPYVIQTTLIFLTKDRYIFTRFKHCDEPF